MIGGSRYAAACLLSYLANPASAGLHPGCQPFIGPTVLATAATASAEQCLARNGTGVRHSLMVNGVRTSVVTSVTFSQQGRRIELESGFDVVEQHKLPKDSWFGGWGWKSGPTVAIPVTYVPTCVAAIDSNTICVAGKTDLGYAVIEKWTLSSPSVMEANALAGVELTIAPPTRTSSSEVFIEEISQKDWVSDMFKAMGSLSPSVFVGFRKSKSLIRLDLATRTYDTNAWPADIPDQNKKLGFYRRDNHIFKGYLYFLNVNSNAILVLIDVNRDGILDSHEVIRGAEEWSKSGYGDLENFRYTEDYEVIE